jgi:outer membrane protein OmpA-like peptidoglycan-associated protein
MMVTEQMLTDRSDRQRQPVAVLRRNRNAGVLGRALGSAVLLFALGSSLAAVRGAETQTRTIPSGKAKVHGIIDSRDGNKISVREDANTVVVLATDSNTRISLRHGLFGMSRKNATADELIPGLYVEAEGRGTETGELETRKIVFQPNAQRTARAVDTRVRPVEARAGVLESRATELEGRTDKLQTRASDLESRSTTMEAKQQETDQQVGAVKQTAGEANEAAQKANTGVTNLGDRVTNLDNYEAKSTATIFFALNSSQLNAKAKKDLDALVQPLENEKGYMVEVAGYTDTTGSKEVNQVLSDRRAAAVVRYLQQDGNVPLRRIFAPAGLGTSHASADNKSREGRQQNRRVEVRVLVNRGLTSGVTTAQAQGSSPTVQ